MAVIINHKKIIYSPYFRRIEILTSA